MTVAGEFGATSESTTPSRRHAAGKTVRGRAFIQAGLARIIEGEILPRLVRAHVAEALPAASTARPPTPERIATFALDLITRDPDEAETQALLNEGLPLDSLLLDLLTPAARHLGRMWEEDKADFLDVTLALGRLHGLARTLCAHLETPDVPSTGRRILLTPCPGETHLFSLTLVASFFREAGWEVVVSSGASDDALRYVRNERFELIGISLSCDVHLPMMVELLTELRSASRNPEVRILVGGPLFLRDPACAIAIGADATAEDGRAAVQIAEALFMA